jgi:hypothetical protein
MNRAIAPAQALLLAACAWLPSCGLNQAGVDPPRDTIAYPASAIMDRNGDWLFVTNSNADLRYNDGTLMAFSLTRAEGDRHPANSATRPDCLLVDDPNPRSDDKNKCCWDALDNNILNCDERFYVGATHDEGNGDQNVRIGSFAAGMVLQHLQCPVDFAQDQSQGEVDCSVCAGASSPEDRLMIGVRGDTSLTWIDTLPSAPDRATAADTPPTFNCTAPPGEMPPDGPFQACDAFHRVVQAPNALASPQNNPTMSQPIPLPDEPYALAIDYTSGLLYVGHLDGSTARPYSGGFSLFDIAPQLDANTQRVLLKQPRFIAPFPAPFPASSLGGIGVTTLNVQTDANGLTRQVLASSRFVPEVAGLGTTATCPDNPLREIAAFPNGTAFSSPLGGSETRGIQYIAGMDRAFVLQRSPPALLSFVASSMAATETLETCGSPTFLDQHDSGVGPRLFVTCFADGEVYVFDPAVPQLVKTFPVGRGPSGLVFDDDRKVAYVVGFGDNNISVVDLDPTSPTEYHVIQRIGFPSTVPR